ncbi:cold and drought-regulated protein CORA-like [Osmia bicornis bicornis]|uniref:cold and drought-regulated protein CORA-like n=1 Tax=Osmia bicornis bicornis TaxID=1437191 RepID=UPI0010F47ED2|nr:cold and drought-regulated protein CORA-like [Osmia bicornis bicornis]
MNLLLLLLLALVALGTGITVPEKVVDTNDVAQQVANDNQPQLESQDNDGDKKVAKRSYGWNPWIYSGYSYGWPWYGIGSGHGWYPGGWYTGWPAIYGHGYGGYFGYRGYGGWYKGW